MFFAISFVLQFRVNEFGALEVITDETEMESVKKATATTTWMVPTAQEGQLRVSKRVVECILFNVSVFLKYCPLK